MYAVISTDFKMHIFNEFMILMRQFPLGISHVYEAFFIEESDTLVTSSINGCHLFKLTCDVSMSPDTALVLDPSGDRLGV